MLPELRWLQSPLREAALRLIYTALLVTFCLVFTFIILPLSCMAGLSYGVAVWAQSLILGKPPGRYIEEANLKKSGISYFEYFLVVNRIPLVLALVLPASQLSLIYVRLRTEYVQLLHSAPVLHAARVKAVTQQLEQWRAEGGNKKIVTSRPGWVRVSPKRSTYKKDQFKVHVNNMTDILHIDEEACTVTVEPMVTMGTLIPALLKKGWTLPVVPELEDLTVGGMIAGTGVESSSHHSGLFQEFCLELEIVLANGNVVVCSRQHQEDLFEAFFWSYGTLGLLMSAKLRILRSAPYIRLVYHGCDTSAAFIDLFKAESEKGLTVAKEKQKPDSLVLPGGCSRFVEGLMFSSTCGVVMLGNFATEVGQDGKLYEHGKWYMPYFYVHAMENMKKALKGETVVEYLPLQDYYYRHSRSVFWTIENIIPLGYSPIFRWTYGWMLPPSVPLLKVTTPQTIDDFYAEKHIIQDMLIPVANLEDGLEIFHKHFDIFPIWVCPMLLSPGKGLVHAKGDEQVMFVDLGAYGVPGAVKRGEDYDLVHEMRHVERYVASVQGFEMLYAECYMLQDEFAEMFDRKLYDELRQRLGADRAFPDVYHKIVEPKRLQQLEQRYGRRK